MGSGALVLRNGIYGVMGFMSSSVAGIKVGMRALLMEADKMAAMDWRVIPLNWREELSSPGHPLKVGYYVEDGNFPATPGMVRAVMETVELLRKAGHQVEPWTPPCLKTFNALSGEFVFADRGHFFLKTMATEKVDQCMKFISLSFSTPKPLHKLVSLILHLFSPSLQRTWGAGAFLSRDLWVANAKKDTAIYQLSKAWEEKRYDVLICPTFGTPATPPEYQAWLLPAGSYSNVWNIAGNPAGVVPVTKETAGDQAKLEDYPVSGDLCHRWARNATLGAEGCPIGVQVVGRHYQEELVIHAMQQIEKLVKENQQ